jgi:sugar phosphate isomerase/epimerase
MAANATPDLVVPGLGGPATIPEPGNSLLGSFSLNQKTIERTSIPELISLCQRFGIESVGLWREPIKAYGIERTARQVRDAGLRVSSLCRGGFFTAFEPDAWRAQIEENKTALEEAAEIHAPCLILVVGGLSNGSKDLSGARRQVVDSLGELAPLAESLGVRLALEPLHPMFCSDRSVLSTFEQAVTIAENFPALAVGVVFDTYHVWWEPEIESTLMRSRNRIAAYQVSDWYLPLASDPLMSRALMGDGTIDFARLHGAVQRAGYVGDVEVEIFNEDIWSADPDQVVATALQRYVTLVLGRSEYESE